MFAPDYHHHHHHHHRHQEPSTFINIFGIILTTTISTICWNEASKGNAPAIERRHHVHPSQGTSFETAIKYKIGFFQHFIVVIKPTNSQHFIYSCFVVAYWKTNKQIKATDVQLCILKYGRTEMHPLVLIVLGNQNPNCGVCSNTGCVFKPLDLKLGIISRSGSHDASKSKSFSLDCLLS